jgi:hypothetical protein
MAAANLTTASINAQPIYGPWVKTWKDPEHSGVLMARHMTQAGKEWMKEAEARGYSEMEAMIKLQRAFYVKNNQLPSLPEVRIATASLTAANSPVDSTPDDVPLEDNSKPDFHHLFGDIKLAHAIKDKLNDPGSYQTLSVGEPFPNRKRWPPGYRRYW